MVTASSPSRCSTPRAASTISSWLSGCRTGLALGCRCQGGAGMAMTNNVLDTNYVRHVELRSLVTNDVRHTNGVLRQGVAGMSTTITAPASPDTGAGSPYRWRWVVLALVLAAEVMDLLDATIVNVAAPSIRTSLSGSYTSIQWIGAGYTLAFA